MAIVVSGIACLSDRCPHLPPSLAIAAPWTQYCGGAAGAAIPPLASKDTFLVRQVQAFIRHGERMRATPGDCWAGDEDTAFSCTLLGTPVTHAWPPAQPGDPVNWAVATLRGGMNRTQPKPSYVLPGNCTLGQLTEAGRQMQLRNGASLRAAYVGPDAAVGPLLPEGYATAADLSHDVFLRSDDHAGGDRTMLSGMALASAMLVPEDAPARPRAPLPWNLFPAHNDTMNPGAACPRYNVEQGIVLQGKAFQSFINSNASKTLLASLPTALWPHAHTRADPSLPFDCGWSHWCPTRDQPALRDAIPAALLAPGPVPGNGADGVSGSLFDRLNWFMGKLFGFLSDPRLSNDPNIARYGAGPLMGDVLAAMQAAADGDKGAKKFVLVSGHDTGPINPVLGALGVLPSDPYEPPPFAAMIVLELLQAESTGRTLYVRVMYNGNVVQVPWKGVCGPVGPGGDWLCDWLGFSKRVAAMVPTEAECYATA